MPAFDYRAAKANGYTDEQIADFLRQKRAEGVDIYIPKAEVAAIDTVPSHTPVTDQPPTQTPGDPDYRGPLGASLAWIAKNTPEQVKYPFNAVLNTVVPRLQAGSAALWRPVVRAAAPIGAELSRKYAEETGTTQAITPEMVEAAKQAGGPPGGPLEWAGSVARGFALGESPEPGLDRNAALDEMLSRYFGQPTDASLLSPEAQDKISRAALGLPVGEVAGALLGPAGVSMMMQGPAANAMNATGGAAWRAGMAATGKIPAVATARKLGQMKTRAVRQSLAEQAEQELALKPAHKLTKATGKAQGKTFEEIDARVRDAMERAPQDAGKALAALTPEERAVADIYRQFNEGQVAADIALNLRKGELGAHIEAARLNALKKIREAELQREFATNLGEARIPAATGGGRITSIEGVQPKGSGANYIRVGTQMRERELAEKFAREMGEAEIPGWGPGLPLKSFSPRGRDGGLKKPALPKTTTPVGRDWMPTAMPFNQPPTSSGPPPFNPKLGEETISAPAREVSKAASVAESEAAKLRRLLATPARKDPFRKQPEETKAGSRSVAKAERRAGLKEAAATKAVIKFEKTVKKSRIAAPRVVPSGKIDLPGAKQVLEQTPKMLVGDAARLPTAAGAEAIRKARGLRAKGPAYSKQTGFAARGQPVRVGDRTITAVENEARFALRFPKEAAKGTKLFRTQFESTLKRGERRAQTRAGAGLLREIEKEFGTPVRGGAVPADHTLLSELPISKTAMLPDEIKRIENVAVPSKVFRQADAITKTISDSSLGEAKNIWEKGAKTWKATVLFRTGYPLRNWMDNASTLWLGGARAEDALDAAEAMLVASGKGDPSKMMRSLKMTYGEYVKSARRNGAMTGGFLTHEVPTGPQGKLGAPLRAFRSVNAAGENYARTWLDISKRATGSSADEAGQFIDDMLGKYHPAFLSPLERKVGTYGFPWYNWIKQIAKRSFRLTVERPGSLARGSSALRAINRSQGFTQGEVEALGPDVKAGGAIVRKFMGEGAEPGDVEVFVTSFLGPGDINRMFGTGEKGLSAIGLNPAAQTYPPIQALIALASGVNPGTGKKLTGADEELPGFSKVITMYPDLARNLGIKRLDNGKVMGPDRVNYVLRQMGPQSIAIGDLSSSDPQAKRRARAFWTGFSSFVRNPQVSQDIKDNLEKGVWDEEIKNVYRSEFAKERALKTK